MKIRQKEVKRSCQDNDHHTIFNLFFYYIYYFIVVIFKKCLTCLTKQTNNKQDYCFLYRICNVSLQYRFLLVNCEGYKHFTLRNVLYCLDSVTFVYLQYNVYLYSIIMLAHVHHIIINNVLNYRTEWMTAIKSVIERLQKLRKEEDNMAIGAIPSKTPTDSKALKQDLKVRTTFNTSKYYMYIYCCI